jgi:hypothetical protein
MRWIGFTLALVLLAVTAAPVMTQPFGPPGPRAPAILNGCTENALFAILNSSAGQACLPALPRAANVDSDFSIFCNAGRWGCCLKTHGLPSGCKIEEAIPTKRRTPPVLAPR